MLAWAVLVFVAMSVKHLARFASKARTSRHRAFVAACTDASDAIARILRCDDDAPITPGFEAAAAIAAVAVATGKTIDEAIALALAHATSISQKEFEADVRIKLARAEPQLKGLGAAFKTAN